MRKIKKVLLVDDSRATNFFNKTLLLKTEKIEEILVAENGKEAIEILSSGHSPEIIFLDINMPVMNGWEFLSKYQELEQSKKDTVIVLMIGASLSDEDKGKVAQFPQVKAFEDKMLNKTVIDRIVEELSKTTISSNNQN